MTNFDIAFRKLNDLFGAPNWNKEGQDAEKIKSLWEKELEGYNESQINEACYRLFRYGKTMRFPTISQLMAMIYDEEKPSNNEYKSKKCSCPEIDLYEFVRPACSFGKFKAAFEKMVNDFRIEYPAFDNSTFSEDGLETSMQNNGWWETKILEYL